MYLLDEDYFELTTLYNSLLNSLKNDFINNYEVTLENALAYIQDFYAKLPNLTSETINLSIYNIPSNGILSLYGFQLCRYTNILLYDFLNILNMSPIKQYIYIDDNNDWHQVNITDANHIVICIIQNENKLFLDLYNNIYFRDNLAPITIPDKIFVTNSQVFEELDSITSLMNKYINAIKLGIKHLYN